MKLILNTFDMRLPFVRFNISNEDGVERLALNIVTELGEVPDIDDITVRDIETIRIALSETFPLLSTEEHLDFSISPYVTYSKEYIATMSIPTNTGEMPYKWNPNLGAMTPNTYIGVTVDKLTSNIPTPVDFIASCVSTGMA